MPTPVVSLARLIHCRISPRHGSCWPLPFWACWPWCRLCTANSPERMRKETGMETMSGRGFLIGSAAMLALAAFRPARLATAFNFRIFGDAARATTPITPNDEFYITSYRHTPEVDAKGWSLRIKGLVRNPLSLTYDSLLKRPHSAMISTLECIGNSIGGGAIRTGKRGGGRLSRPPAQAGGEPPAGGVGPGGCGGPGARF